MMNPIINRNHGILRISSYISKYFNILGKKAIISNSLLSGFKILFAPSNGIVVSDNKFVRGIGRLRHLDRIRATEAEDKSTQFFALEDAFSLLHQKGIPVYFYNRVGREKTSFPYSEKEKHRMKEGLSFPLMYLDIDRYEEDLKNIFGELYSKKYVQEIGKIPQVVKIGSTYQHEDYNSELINVENGKSVTLNQPNAYTRTIHIYGRCGVFGYAVEDRDSIPSLLQKELLQNGITDIKVINHGLWGGTDEYLDHNFLQESVGMKAGDVVLFYRMHFEK